MLKDILISIICVLVIIIIIALLAILYKDSKEEKIKIEHKIHRVYSNSFYSYKALSDLLKEGWKVKSASEAIKCSDGYYMDYILYKEENNK